MDSHQSQSSATQQVGASRTQKRNLNVISLSVLGVGIIVTSLLAMGIMLRLKRQAELQAAVKATENTVPSVNVIPARKAPAATELALPGSVVSLNQTTIYAQTTGYLRRWLVDIGDRVKSGQLLAEIDAPQTDQQVQQARADLAQAQATLVQSRDNLAKAQSDLQQAQANLNLALITWQRWQILVQQGVVAQQDADQKLAAYQTNKASVLSAQNAVRSYNAGVSAAQANVYSRQANLQQYIVQQSFQQVKAPFTGVITARNVNEGRLVTAGTSSNGNNSSLYTIASYTALEVNVNVPQTYVQSINNALTAQIQVRELPGRIFTGKVIRTTSNLDQNSRTLLTQLSVPNPSNLLRPGMYTTVKFVISQTRPPLLVPNNSLVIDSGGTQVATVTKNQTVHYQPVSLGRDDGKTVEITSGLNENQLIVSNPTVDLTEGTRVHAVAAVQ